MKKVCHNVVPAASLWNRSWVWILRTTFSATTGSSAPSSLPWMWSWCPEGPPVFTPVLFQSVLRTETGVALLKDKQVVPHLCSAPSDDWGSHLPQNKSQSLYRTHTLNCPLPLWSAPLVPLTLSLLTVPCSRHCLSCPASELLRLPLPSPGVLLLQGTALLTPSLPLGLDSPSQWGFPYHPVYLWHFLLSFSAFIFLLALFTL